MILYTTVLHGVYSGVPFLFLLRTILSCLRTETTRGCTPGQIQAKEYSTAESAFTSTLALHQYGGASGMKNLDQSWTARGCVASMENSTAAAIINLATTAKSKVWTRYHSIITRDLVHQGSQIQTLQTCD